jgi:hypothetical protein
MTTRDKPVLDPDEILDRIGDREPTEEEARLFMAALGITADALVARVHASVDAAPARDTGHAVAPEVEPALPPPSAPANDTLPPPAMKKDTPRRWALWAVAAAFAAGVIGTTGAFVAHTLDLPGVSPPGSISRLGVMPLRHEPSND